MDWFWDLITNPYLLTALSAWFVAQAVKTVLYAVMNGRIDWERLVGDGGMPSGHSATVTSLALFCALMHGTHTHEFAVSAILAIIVCHDAMGVRQETGKQAILINEIVDTFEKLTVEHEIPEIELKEFVGHTPLQVVAGVLVGALTALFMYFVVFA
ncbi:MAG: divergent PAP2 family protein [Oscillospiraceae bacterium]|nr:divergent PAP2 family protein [Oscillospiraceae bacterium]